MRSIILVASLAAASFAHAETDEELAKAHYLTGQSYFRQTRYREALQQFDEAYRIAKRPALFYNMALCHEQLGQRSEAATSFELYLAADPTTGDRAEIERRIGVLRSGNEPTPTPAPSAVVEAPPQTPVHKTGWFWGVVVGSTAVVVLAVVLGVVLGGADGGPRTLQPVPVR